MLLALLSRGIELDYTRILARKTALHRAATSKRDATPGVVQLGSYISSNQCNRLCPNADPHLGGSQSGCQLTIASVERLIRAHVADLESDPNFALFPAVKPRKCSVVRAQSSRTHPS